MRHIGTKPIETGRLLLRRFAAEDARAMFENWASDLEVTRFMRWEPHQNVEETQETLDRWLEEYTSEKTYHWGIVLKESGELIGSLGLMSPDDHDHRAEAGYCIGRAYWGQGYTSEALEAVTHAMFFDGDFNRIEAYHDVRNPASGAVMRKAGMKREGFARQKYKSHDVFRDADLYGVVKDDLFHPAPFEGFLDWEGASDGELSMICIEKNAAKPEIDWVPDYRVEFRVGEKKVGTATLRIGMCDALYFGGQIGFQVEKTFRGHGYAQRACKLLLPLIRHHGFRQILICNDHQNAPSRRVCEKLGARMVRIVDTPPWHELYARGERRTCIWAWNVQEEHPSK